MIYFNRWRAFNTLPSTFYARTNERRAGTNRYDPRELMFFDGMRKVELS